MKISQYKQMMAHLTKPKTNLDLVVYDPAIEEKKAHHNLDIDNLGKPKKKPVDIAKRIADASAKYDGYVPEDAKVPEALKPDPKKLMSDKTEQYLRKQIIEKMNREPLDSDEVRFLMDTKPKKPNATVQEMTDLKKTLEKSNIKKEKPVTNKRRSVALNIQSTNFDPTPIALTKAPIRTPEELEQEQKFKQMLKDIEEEKQRFKNSGLAYLMGQS